MKKIFDYLTIIGAYIILIIAMTGGLQLVDKYLGPAGVVIMVVTYFFLLLSLIFHVIGK